MATLDHAALWTPDLERLRAFYEHYFDAAAGEKYVNPDKDFSSYFLEFDSGARLELMYTPTLTAARDAHPAIGYGHIALSVGSEHAVDTLTARLQDDGYTVCSEPRWTGDGYYESVVLDPDENRVEITV